MSNRTDYIALAYELAEQFGLSKEARKRVEGELHNAHVAGQEGSDCECASCKRVRRGGEQQWQRVVILQYIDVGMGVDWENASKTIKWLSKLDKYRYIDRDGMIREVPIRCVTWNELTTSIEAEVLGEFEPMATKEANFGFMPEQRDPECAMAHANSIRERILSDARERHIVQLRRAANSPLLGAGEDADRLRRQYLKEALEIEIPGPTLRAGTRIVAPDSDVSGFADSHCRMLLDGSPVAILIGMSVDECNMQPHSERFTFE